MMVMVTVVMILLLLLVVVVANCCSGGDENCHYGNAQDCNKTRKLHVVGNDGLSGDGDDVKGDGDFGVNDESYSNHCDDNDKINLCDKTDDPKSCYGADGDNEKILISDVTECLKRSFYDACAMDENKLFSHRGGETPRCNDVAETESDASRIHRDDDDDDDDDLPCFQFAPEVFEQCSDPGYIEKKNCVALPNSTPQYSSIIKKTYVYMKNGDRMATLISISTDLNYLLLRVKLPTETIRNHRRWIGLFPKCIIHSVICLFDI
jgi:hypothetical protein